MAKKAKKSSAPRAVKAAPVKVAGSATDRLNAERAAAAKLLKVGDTAEIVSGSRKGELVKVTAIVGGYVTARDAQGAMGTWDAYKLRPAQ